MAQNGNVALPTGGRFTAVRPTSLPSVHALQVIPSPPREVISLEQLRPPGMPRSQNVYVESPTFNNGSQTKLLPKEDKDKVRQNSGESTSTSSKEPIIDKQPVKSSITKTYTKVDGTEDSSKQNNNVSVHTHRDVIICPECGKCRCGICTNPRPLPSKWLCTNKCLCSAEQCVDYCTCMYCVKAGFYLCVGDLDSDSGSEVFDKPCSCAPEHRCMRWTCLSVLSVILPCLFCYWPMRGCVKLGEKCYNCYHSTGCHCQRHGPPAPATDRRLLDPNSDSTG